MKRLSFRIKIIIFSLLLIIFFILPGFEGDSNQTGTGPGDNALWIQTGGPPGGSFGVIEINPYNPDILYTGSGLSIFRSDNGAESWRRIEQLHTLAKSEELGITSVVFDPLDSDTVYISSRCGLFKSSDNGITWQLLTSNINHEMISSITIDPVEPSIIYITTTGENKSDIYKSTNGGDSWSKITGNIPPGQRFNVICAVKHDELFAGGGSEMNISGNLYHSTDGGNNWQALNIGQGEDTFVSLIRMDPVERDHIFIGFADSYNRGREITDLLFETHDGGKSWRPATGKRIINEKDIEKDPTLAGMPVIGSIISDIEIARSNNNIIYYLSPLHRSEDGGRTWKPVGSWNEVEDFGKVEQNTIAIDPTDENILYATLMGQGVAKSTDRGKTWWLANEGLISSVITNIVADPEDKDVVYASGGDGSGTWKTDDGGNNWTVLNKGGIEHAWVDELTIDPANPDVLFNVTDTGDIFKTEDGGNTWKHFNNGFTFSSIYEIAVDPKDQDIVYASNNGLGIFKSTTGGDHWEYLLGSPDYSYSIAIDPVNTNNIYSGYSKKVFEDSSKVYKSSDFGESWEAVFEIKDSEAVTSVAVNPGNPDVVYAGSTGQEGEIYTSNDTGSSWEKLNDDLTFTTIWGHSQLQVDPTEKNVIYAGTWGGGTFKSVDGGISWEKLINAPQSPTCIDIYKNNPEIIYACDRTEPVIHRSEDGGRTWSKYYEFESPCFMTSALAIHPDNPDIIYAGAFKIPLAQAGPLIKIEDGVKVADLSQGIPRAVLEIEIDTNNPDTIYVTTHGHGVFKSENEGKKWERLDDRDNGLPRNGFYDIDVDHSNSEILYATSLCGELPYYVTGPAGLEKNLEGRCGVYKSYDSGKTWEIILETESEARGITIDPKNPDVLYVASMTQGIFVSNDGGDSWTRQVDGLGSLSMTSVAVKDDYIYAGTQGSGVYSGKINNNYSITWDKSRSNKPKVYVSKIQIEIDPENPDRIYASAYPGGLLRSDDGGETWNDKNFLTPSIIVDDPVREGYYSFAIDKNDTKKVWMGVYGKGIFVSYDYNDFNMVAHGKNGKMLHKNITSVAIDPRQSGVVYVSTDNGVFVTKDGGNNWDDMSDGIIVDDIVSLAIGQRGKLYAGSRGYGVYTYDELNNRWDGPYKVKNFGVYWYVWDRPLYMYNSLLINPFDDDIMYFGTFPSGFYKTTDGGVTWYERNKNFTIDGAFSMAFDPYNKDIIYAGTYNGVSKSEDGGNSWEKIDKGMPSEQWVFSIVIDPLDTNNLYISTKNGENKGYGREGFHGLVMKSDDGGKTWFEIMNGLEKSHEYYQLVMYPFNYDVLFVSTDCGIYITSNGGESWQPINDGIDINERIIGSGIVNNVANNLTIDTTGKHLYLGTAGRGVYVLDIEKLGLKKDPDAIPLHCFNYIKDFDESGVDCGGSCKVDCKDYNYGKAEPGYTSEVTEETAIQKEKIKEDVEEDKKIIPIWVIYALPIISSAILITIITLLIYFWYKKKNPKR